jgi:2-C-methyl-D-erythritol 4-phosphate cytidylyltransferase / 2-C-methyl-D-erythritol 2,4-cyclodiphosphate synthase
MPAAGAGRRMGAVEGLPKQYRSLGGRTVLEQAVALFIDDPECLGVVFALAPDDVQFATLPLASHPRCHTTIGGAERRDSVLAGLRYVASREASDPWVLVHDAARPCLARADLAALRAALTIHPDGALLAVRVADTVKRSDAEGRVAATIPREGLWRAQTPQAFRLARLQQALEACPTATDESSAMEALGARPALVPGSPDNLKITEPADLASAVRILAGGSTMAEQRVGFGVDVHAFGDGDHVWLGGVRIPHTRGVVAHSDGDVVLHALCDALLGAVGLGDIGQHFPDSDPRWKGAASVLFLRHVLALVAERGFAPVNVDITLLCEAPKVAPHRDAIRTRLAAELALSEDRVNVKATTTEKLGYLGRREGLAAEVIALVATRS